MCDTDAAGSWKFARGVLYLRIVSTGDYLACRLEMIQSLARLCSTPPPVRRAPISAEENGAFCYSLPVEHSFARWLDRREVRWW